MGAPAAAAETDGRGQHPFSAGLVARRQKRNSFLSAEVDQVN